MCNKRIVKRRYLYSGKCFRNYWCPVKVSIFILSSSYIVVPEWSRGGLGSSGYGGAITETELRCVMRIKAGRGNLNLTKLILPYLRSSVIFHQLSLDDCRNVLLYSGCSLVAGDDPPSNQST